MFDITITRTDKKDTPVVKPGGATLHESMMVLGAIIVQICDIYGVHGQVLVKDTEDELSASRYLGWETKEGFKPFIMVTLTERAHA